MRVKQRQNNDCIITCLDALTELSYINILNELGIGANRYQFVDYLNDNGYKTTCYLTKDGYEQFGHVGGNPSELIGQENIKDIIKDKKGVAIIYQNYEYHAVVVYKNGIIDPMTSKSVSISKLTILDLVIIH